MTRAGTPQGKGNMATNTDDLSEETRDDLVDLIDEALQLVGLSDLHIQAVIDVIDMCVDVDNQDRSE